MGLDMYLHKRTWIGVEARERLTMNGLPDTVEPSKVTYVIEDAGCWRKANAIHRWFVDNIQNGNDDCGLYEVRREQLQALLRSVDTVLAHPDMAARLLPTQEGFFFGSTEYDEDYVDDLKETRQIVTEALADEEADFEYTSSW